MPKLNFTQDEVDEYLKGKLTHHFRDRTINIATEMAIHADGVFPIRLLRERRPNEPLEVLIYREKIWVPITKPTFSKVFSSLQKIRRSSDWAIKYENLEAFSKITDEDNLESYCEKHFPYFTSLTNWTFSILLRKYLIDPNAVIFTFPIDPVVSETEYLRPFPNIFDSTFVVDYREEDYVVLENPVPIVFQQDGVDHSGKSFYFVTTQKIFRYDQVNVKNDYRLIIDYTHGLNYLPAFKLGGVLIDQAERQFMYESRIAGILPELEEAVREYSDLQAAKVLHIYPERWEFTNNECSACKGTGRRINPNWHIGCGEEIPSDFPCDNKGCVNGYIVSGPYSKMMIKPASSLEGTTIPMPPAGYIQKDIDIIKIQQEGVDGHIYKALSAINFEFLAKTPLSQSGVAKEVDKDELNNTVHSIAEDIVSIMDKIYKTIAYYRYKDLYPLDEIDNMLPDTTVPEVFDLLSAQHLEDELVLSRKNQANPIILNALEIDYATKRFNDQAIRDKLMLSLSLDPLPNMLETDKVLQLQNNGITQVAYIMSCNIQTFIENAIAEDEDFVNLPLLEQKQVIEAMAQAQIDKENKAKAIVKSMFMTNGGNGFQPTPTITPNLSNDDNIQPDNTNNLGFNNRLQPDNSFIPAGYVG